MHLLRRLFFEHLTYGSFFFFLQDVHGSNFQERANSGCATAVGRSAEVRFRCQNWVAVMTRGQNSVNTDIVFFLQRQTDDVKALYCCYLKKEIENRDQEMAYRALKMRKLEKEILLLDKQLM